MQMCRYDSATIFLKEKMVATQHQRCQNTYFWRRYSYASTLRLMRNSTFLLPTYSPRMSNPSLRSTPHHQHNNGLHYDIFCLQSKYLTDIVGIPDGATFGLGTYRWIGIASLKRRDRTQQKQKRKKKKIMRDKTARKKPMMLVSPPGHNSIHPSTHPPPSSPQVKRWKKKQGVPAQFPPSSDGCGAANCCGCCGCWA
jgi:hypothetical protein